jgi:aryl-alcohol dehydrogenase-like predicted oxidoreductase
VRGDDMPAHPDHASKPEVTAPIVGLAKPAHLTDAVSALSVKLDQDEVRILEEAYIPQGAPSFE